MNEALRFLKSIEIWVYSLLGLAALICLRRFVISLNEWRGTNFGLEREDAQRRLSSATSFLVLILLIGVSEFALVTFIYPEVRNIQPLPTPTVTMLTTPTGTLSPTLSGDTPRNATQAAIEDASSNCVPGKLEFTTPRQNDTIKGVVTLKGNLVMQNFGRYKYEYNQPGTSAWITIAGSREIKPDGSLGFWDTSQLVPGDYRLRLVAFDNQDKALPACIVTIKVAAPDPK